MDQSASAPGLPRAWYAASFASFCHASSDEILGSLVSNSNRPLDLEQRDAWIRQISLLKAWLANRSGRLLLEFNVPRMGLRADAVLLLGGCVVVIEFKIGEVRASRSALAQVWEYALDTKNFHEPSHQLPIIPVLVPTGYSAGEVPPREYAPDRVSKPVVVAPHCIPTFLDQLQREFPEPIDDVAWTGGRYKPTPTIVEAARHLFAHHSVSDIVRTEADATNLTDTTGRLESLIELAQREGHKIICFVTGVPGAGKTLVGLNVATSHRTSDSSHAVFLSGNGPLVTVLREALTQDDLARRRRIGEKLTKDVASKPVKAFIQNVHHFRDEGLRDPLRPPADRVVIFDEAQRAWNRTKTAQFMKQRKGQANFPYSEPEFLIDYMNRHEGWAAIICLVGGGQEIHTGEAGIGEWIGACVTRFPDWHVYASQQLTDAEYGAGIPLRQLEQHRSGAFFSDLHLTVALRSFRAEKVSAFVKALLDCDTAQALEHRSTFVDRYPILVTRDLAMAKGWVRSKARAMERFGLLASSKAMRLKPHAIDVRLSTDPIHYFLGPPEDVRSSYYLEDCATEFQVQGLELDWACVTWDADLRYATDTWSYHDFRGSKWQNVNSAENRRNLKNAYRVLLTRARQGMILFVPPGDPEDPTRHPDFYDRTYNYLRSLGIPELHPMNH